MALRRAFPTILSDRLPETRDFYVRLLDFEVAFDSDFYVALRTAEDDDGTAGGGVRRETTAQILRAAEQADDDDVGALGGVAVRRDAPRVGDGVVGAARASAEQVGVGGRDEGDARHEGSSFAGVHARVVMRGLPWHGSRSSGRS